MILLNRKRCFIVSFVSLTFLLIFHLQLSSKRLNYFWKNAPVIVRPIGGIGNQMFQYAAAYSLAKRRNSDLYLCLESNWESFTNNDNLLHFDVTDRSFSLWAFSISYDKIILENGSETKNPETNFVDEKSVFTNGVPDCGMVYLYGYFESETFFESYKQEIMQRLSLKTKVEKQLESSVNSFSSEISSTESVAIHVRRKDFSLEHRFLPISYYEDAINRMKTEIANKVGERKDVTFFVFSDDIDRVKSEFASLTENFVFVSNVNSSRLADFVLMKMCKHIITGNSTFSWWAAYLNDYVLKIVIAPLPKFQAEWYANQNFDELHHQIYGGNLTYPRTWITVNPFGKVS